jgi:gamma-glutamyl:cysteine ligase YbdK (ATP-grasp superfamily)
MQARTLVKRRLRELKPIARELRCADALARVDAILEKGTGSERQEQVWNANRDVREVACELATAAEDV